MESSIGPGATGMNLNHIKVCARCSLRYDWRKSPSTLKMTYCSSLCEAGDLGFTMEALMKLEKAQVVKLPEAASDKEVVAAGK